MVDTRIRKQVCDLTPADLETSEVWEFALDEEGEDGQDEATVRPYVFKGKLNPSAGMYIVRACFTLADGTKMPGYLTPSVQGRSDLGTRQPVIVTPAGQVLFWHGLLEPSSDDIAGSYARLGKSSPEKVFPIQFESQVPLEGGSVTGELPGFIVLKDFTTMTIRVVR